MENNLTKLTLSADDALTLIGILKIELGKLESKLDDSHDNKAYERMIQLAKVRDKLLKFI